MLSIDLKIAEGMQPDDVAPVGSWWRWRGKEVVVGQAGPGMSAPPGTLALWIYRPGFALPLQWVGIEQVMLGNLTPCIPNDLSIMSDAEQDYWRSL